MCNLSIEPGKNEEESPGNRPAHPPAPARPERPPRPEESYPTPPTTTTERYTTSTYPPQEGWPWKHDYKIVCYFTNWAWYRRGVGKYTPEDIDPNLCTHVVYGFAVLDYSTLLIKPHDRWADFDNGEPNFNGLPM